MIHYYIIELDLPEVVGTCTISGNPGFSTPLTCTDQASPTTAIKTHKFTNTAEILAESGIYKCLNSVSETTPKLKAGNGLASRATCTLNFTDFIGDPNPASPALTSNPEIEQQGTFFGKLKERNIIANKKVRVKYYSRVAGVDTLIRTNNYIATDIKRSGSGRWVIVCKDVLYRADNEKSQFPKVVTGKLSSDIIAGSTSVTMEADIADWTPFGDYTAVIGNDLLMITNATGTASSVTLTVARSSVITLGSRTIQNTPEAHNEGDEVFRARKYNSADLYDLFVDIFADAGISTAEYDGTGFQTELSNWLPFIDNSIDCIFYESQESTRVLNDICSTFMLDIFTNTQTGKVELKATTPWNTTTSTLTEGKEITYNSIDVQEPKSLHYSRAFLQYDKRKLTESDDDVNFARSSLAINQDLEGALFYDEEKVKKLSKSIVLSNKTNNIETADLTTVRYTQRFSNRPQHINFEIEEEFLDFALGDVVEISTADNQDIYGNIKSGVRAQVTQISPSANIGRTYKVSTTTYNPFIGGLLGSDININSQFDINLFTESGGPITADTFNFIFDGQSYGQNTSPQAIAIGSFPSGSIVNIVALNGAVLTAKGGDGGRGGSYFDDAVRSANLGGGNGGDTLKGTTGVTVNVYLSGATGDLGNGSYTADGYLFAAGGGGAGALHETQEEDFGTVGYGGGGGGGGSGFTLSTGGPRGSGDTGVNGANGNPGTSSAGGLGGLNVLVGAAGAGGSSLNGGSIGAVSGGLAGKAIIKNGGTVNVLTNGNTTTRFKAGNGDTPDSLT